MNKPHELSAQEWAEVAAVRDVLEGWGIEDENDPAAWLAENVYGVRFDFCTGGPGYFGPLYLLKGDGAAETPPMILVRTKEGLEAVEDCCPSC